MTSNEVAVLQTAVQSMIQGLRDDIQHSREEAAQAHAVLRGSLTELNERLRRLEERVGEVEDTDTQMLAEARGQRRTRRAIAAGIVAISGVAGTIGGLIALAIERF